MLYTSGTGDSCPGCGISRWWPVELVESGEGGVEIDELIHQEEWFPVSLAPDRHYEVSHIGSPILGPGSRIALMLSLVPSADPMSGATVTRLGRNLSSVTRRLSAALSEQFTAVRNSDQKYIPQ